MEFLSGGEDPDRELWDDPDFRAEYLDALVARFEADPPPDPEDWSKDYPPDEPPAPFVRDVEDAEELLRRARALAAAADDQFRRVLEGARQNPDPWVGPDPTLDPDYEDPRGWTHAAVRARRREIAVRAAAMDLGVRAGLSENQVRARAHRALLLAERLPRVWARCVAGDVSEQNAATAEMTATCLPSDAPEAWAALDDLIAAEAVDLAPARFRARARAARERVHPESLQARHARAAADRHVRFYDADDGVTSLYALLPTITATQIRERLEHDARHLRAQNDETRTLAQLRADVLADLLTTGNLTSAVTGDTGNPVATDDTETGTSGAAGVTGDPAAAGPVPAGLPGPKVKATIYLTIPALTLLGHSDQPATLHGYGPISIDDARRIAGEATEWIRVLTHPIDGTILDLERRTYRVPKSLRRWLGYLHPTCIGPGCTRPADHCETDHTTRWSDGGTTSTTNTAPLCHPQHDVKDESLWTYDIHPPTGRITWTSPTGLTTTTDPPPF